MSYRPGDGLQTGARAAGRQKPGNVVLSNSSIDSERVGDAAAGRPPTVHKPS